MYQFPVFDTIQIPNLFETAKSLPLFGRLSVTNNKLVYLNIQDDYIHQLFPLLKKIYPNVEKPNYFGKNLIGAHISVIYPEEKIVNPMKELGQLHHFSLKRAASALLGLKVYYVLLVESLSLIEFRKNFGLDEKLLFKNYLVDLHITIGTEIKLQGQKY